MQIDRKIAWQRAGLVDVIEQPLVARAEQDHVMRDARPRAFDTKMYDERAKAKNASF